MGCLTASIEYELADCYLCLMLPFNEFNKTTYAVCCSAC